jgi:hypothetical protein
MNPEQIKALQQKLQAEGLYAGPIDGVMGPQTQEAATQLRQLEADRADRQAQQRTQELAAQQAQSEAERAQAETRAKEVENDPTNRLTKLGVEIAPVVGGLAAGKVIGSKAFGKPYKEADATIRSDVSRLANSRGIDPKIREQEMNRLLRGRTVRNTAQFGAPAALFGAGTITRELVAPQFADETTQDVIRSVGAGENAAATGLAGQQIVNVLKNQGAAADPVDVARIRSGSLPPDSTPPNVPPPPPQGGNLPPPPGGQGGQHQPMRYSDRAKLAVEAAGGKPGKTKGANIAAVKRSLTPDNMPAVADALNLPRTADRGTILQRLREISRTSGKLALPFLAGGLAYDAATSDAQAGTGVDTGSDVARGAVAGGTAAGLVAGGNRLLQAIPAAARTAMGSGAAMAMPGEIIPAMTDYAPEDINTGRNWLARNLPESVQFGAVDQARQMAQVPERNPMSRPIDPAMPNASALQVPQMPAETYEQEAAPPDFDQYIADLQAIFAEMEQGQQPRRPASRPMPAPPPAYGGQQNRLLQPTGY